MGRSELERLSREELIELALQRTPALKAADVLPMGCQAAIGLG